MTEAKRLTKLVLKVLEGHAGFDEWWDSIDGENQRAIRAAIEEALANTIPENPRSTNQ